MDTSVLIVGFPRMGLWTSCERPSVSRELWRQAILISARHELGVNAIDGVLAEPLPEEMLKRHGLVRARTPNHSYYDGDVRTHGLAMLIDVFVPDGERTSSVLAEGIPAVPPDIQGQYDGLPVARKLAYIEQLSRERLPVVLEELGYGGDAPRPAGGAAVPRPTESLLLDMNAIAQHAALRQVHVVRERDGESPALLGALARGHAHAALLTDYLWNASHAAHRARSLLYAQRLHDADGGSAWAKWHRAYTFALAGLHATALTELDGLEPDDESAPRWAPLIAPYCRFDHAKLQRLAVDELAPLASLLAFRACVLGQAGDRQVALAAELLFRHQPDCLAAVAHLSRFGSCGMRSEMSAAGPSLVAASLPRRLRLVPDLPVEVREILGRIDEAATMQQVGDLGDALIESGLRRRDATWPSFTELGWLVRDGALAHAYLLGYVRGSLACDASWAARELEEVLPALGAHPWRPLVELLTEQDSSRVDEVVGDTVLHDTVPGLAPLLYWTSQTPGKAARKADAAWYWMTDRGTVSADELGHFLRVLQEPDLVLLHRLLESSPYHPIGVAMALEHAKARYESRIDDWLKVLGERPAILRAMLQSQRWDLWTEEDEQRLVRCFERTRDKWSCDTLAQRHEHHGDWSAWKRTIDRFLHEAPVDGLERARVGHRAASVLLRRQRHAEARPYAELAGESYSAWGLRILAHWHAGAGNWREFDETLAAEAERCRSHYWYLACHYYGGGDLESAGRIARAHQDALLRSSSAAEIRTAALLEILEDRPARALALYQRAADEMEGSRTGGARRDLLMVALLADPQREASLRDGYLAAAAALPARGNVDLRPAEHYRLLAETFLDVLSCGDPGRLDEDLIRAVVTDLNRYWRPHFWLRVALFCEKHGTPAQYRRYLEKCVLTSFEGQHEQAIACKRLRALGVDPLEARRRARWPAPAPGSVQEITLDARLNGRNVFLLRPDGLHLNLTRAMRPELRIDGRTWEPKWYTFLDSPVPEISAPHVLDIGDPSFEVELLAIGATTGGTPDDRPSRVVVERQHGGLKILIDDQEAEPAWYRLRLRRRPSGPNPLEVLRDTWMPTRSVDAHVSESHPGRVALGKRLEHRLPGHRTLEVHDVGRATLKLWLSAVGEGEPEWSVWLADARNVSRGEPVYTGRDPQQLPRASSIAEAEVVTVDVTQWVPQAGEYLVRVIHEPRQTEGRVKVWHVRLDVEPAAGS